jgi:hypothetical protein
MQINPDKTEIMLIGSAANLKNYDKSQPINIAGASIVPQDSVKILGVTLDATLSFDKHVSAICQSCNFNMRALRHIRPLLSHDTANELACSIVASRLDYCNALLFNTSAHNIDKLQRLQNNLARIVCSAPARSNANLLLQKLHWLPIKHRIDYKIACITFKVITTDTPSYLRAVINAYVPPRALRSSNHALLQKPDTSRSLVIANRAFSLAAPSVWNKLSLATRTSPTLPMFKNRLKTELFACAFNIVRP